ncbi:hypothetical protein CSA56_10370 [candidate division KSB3 bacterium]|uniref:HTH cro/C1-type domain-containing protein n=1 Tax=candidate division KSB3 bacterium TaxID=2044937 RepID=A0A2G6KFK3_9BACT|nr:MAG: hypothetical protein CSA56_10370 [candidate division KSB3 bacterium]
MDYSEIAQKIKELRTKKRLSIQELADKAGLTPGYLSKIENSEKPPPIPTLSKIAYALNVHISYFFDDEKSESGVSLVRKGERKEIIGDLTQIGYRYETVIQRKPDSHLNSFILTLPPEVDPQSVPYNSHDGEELIYVIEGVMIFHYGDSEYQVSEGDSLYFPATSPHRIVRATKTGSARVLSVLFLN